MPLSWSTTDETAVKRLQREIRELTARVAHHEQQTASSFAALEGRIREVDERLSARVAETETSQRALRRSALRREVRGAQLFMFGAILSAAGAVV